MVVGEAAGRARRPASAQLVHADPPSALPEWCGPRLTLRPENAQVSEESETACCLLGSLPARDAWRGIWQLRLTRHRTRDPAHCPAPRGPSRTASRRRLPPRRDRSDHPQDRSRTRLSTIFLTVANGPDDPGTMHEIDGRNASGVQMTEFRTSGLSRGQPAPTSVTARDLSWQAHAACRWHRSAFDGRRDEQALRICGACPVLVPCRAWALRTAVAGVAGGLTESARSRWRRRFGLPEPNNSLDDYLPADVAAADATVLERPRGHLRAI